MDFLYSRNRLNVATSRARCVAVVVGSPDLLARPRPDARRRCGSRTRSAGSSSWRASRRPARRSTADARGADARPRLSDRSRPSGDDAPRLPRSRPTRLDAAPPARPHVVARRGRRARQHRAHRGRHGRHDRGPAPRRFGGLERRHRARPSSSARPSARSSCRGSWSAAGAGSGWPRATRSASSGRVVATVGVIARVAAAAARRDRPHRLRQRLEPAVALRRRRPLSRTTAGRRRSGSSSGAPRSARSSGRTSSAPAGELAMSLGLPRARRAVPRPDRLRRRGGDPVASCSSARPVRARRRDRATDDPTRRTARRRPRSRRSCAARTSRWRSSRSSSARS